ncbi:Synaptic vesicle transporter SVOP and related transporters (major facilitator superfamily) [Ceraceosorus bombacis]|uniref:Synaptic vesicle transporter SVOP and related transporters (Major facilitator superfamily) n=1 Tax=Ceraceosorus bombacis TaxID=401625 RepID=A0A0P1BFC0_9BASI|nr:Synaptic vesicle transporter SVOP and related transporters (major facilitator superfamily) [Ceraceosorus bombacis]
MADGKAALAVPTGDGGPGGAAGASAAWLGSQAERGCSVEGLGDEDAPHKDDEAFSRERKGGKVKADQIAEEPYSTFSSGQIHIIIAAATLAAFLSPLTANAILPVLSEISRDLNVPIEDATLSVTIFAVGQGIFPLIFGSYTDLAGRRPIFFICLIIYAVANVVLANLPDSYPGLLVLRLIQAMGSASLISIGAGAIGDVIPTHRRGRAYGIFQAGIAGGPSIGPIVGGIIGEEAGWRAIFWLLFALGAVALLLLVLFLPETLRSLVGNGSTPPPTVWHEALWTLIRGKTASQLKGERRKGWPSDPSHAGMSRSRRILSYLSRPLRPLRLFARYEITLLLVINAIPYAAFYCWTTTISDPFAGVYGLNTLQSGLIFLSSGSGTVLASILSGWIMDHDYATAKAKVEARSKSDVEANSAEKGAEQTDAAANLSPNSEQNGIKGRADDAFNEATREALHPTSSRRTSSTAHASAAVALSTPPATQAVPLEAARFKRYPIYIFVASATFIGYGWCLQSEVHISVPIILFFFNAASVGGIMAITQVLLVDYLASQGASVTACNNLCRCLSSAVSTAIIQYILKGIGRGWTFTLLGLITLASAPLVPLTIIKSSGWRAKREAEKLEAAEKVQLSGKGKV